MNHYAYRIYKNIPSNPVIGGTVTAENMESAAQKIISQNGIQVIHELRNGLEYHHFMRNNIKVGILVYIRPEDF
jgi:hypothetical protein